jgi:uncharacterized protein with HEPN domain
MASLYAALQAVGAPEDAARGGDGRDERHARGIRRHQRRVERRAPRRPPFARWLNDIPDNIRLAESFAANLDSVAFCADTLRVYGVTRCLEIISEASRRLPDELKRRHPSIPWQEMAGAGNVYRHDYEEVDASEVWVTVQDHLPKLRLVVERELIDLGGSTDLRI